MVTLFMALQLLLSPAKGTLQHALNDARSCGTPTAWVARDGAFFYAVCGTADRRVCGDAVSWTSPECSNE